MKTLSKPHPKCIFQSVGVIEASLKTQNNKYLLLSGDTPYKVAGFSSQTNKRWQATLDRHPTNRIKNKIRDTGECFGFWLVYPCYEVLNSKLYLSFQIKKRLASHDAPGIFNVQGSIYKQKPSETILAIGRNKGQPKWVKPRTLPVKGSLEANRFELWHFNLKLDGYQFHIQSADKVADTSPYIKFS